MKNINQALLNISDEVQTEFIQLPGCMWLRHKRVREREEVEFGEKKGIPHLSFQR